MPATFLRAAPYADDVLNLPVGDVAASVPYYETFFGMTLVAQEDEPVRRAVLERDGIEIGFAENGGDPSQEGAFIEVNNLEEMHAEFVDRGLSLGAPNFRTDAHGDTTYRVFFVIAPDGLCYCVGQQVIPAS